MYRRIPSGFRLSGTTSTINNEHTYPVSVCTYLCAHRLDVQLCITHRRSTGWDSRGRAAAAEACSRVPPAPVAAHTASRRTPPRRSGTDSTDTGRCAAPARSRRKWSRLDSTDEAPPTPASVTDRLWEQHTPPGHAQQSWVRRKITTEGYPLLVSGFDNPILL